MAKLGSLSAKRGAILLKMGGGHSAAVLIVGVHFLVKRLKEWIASPNKWRVICYNSQAMSLSRETHNWKKGAHREANAPPPPN